MEKKKQQVKATRRNWEDYELEIFVGKGRVKSSKSKIRFRNNMNNVFFEVWFSFSHKDTDEKKSVTAERQVKDFVKIHKYWQCLLGKNERKVLPKFPKRKKVSKKNVEEELKKIQSKIEELMKVSIEVHRIKSHVSLWDFVDVSTEERPTNLLWTRPKKLWDISTVSDSEAAIEFEPKDIWGDEIDEEDDENSEEEEEGEEDGEYNEEEEGEGEVGKVEDDHEEELGEESLDEEEELEEEKVVEEVGSIGEGEVVVSIEDKAAEIEGEKEVVEVEKEPTVQEKLENEEIVEVKPEEEEEKKKEKERKKKSRKKKGSFLKRIIKLRFEKGYLVIGGN